LPSTSIGDSPHQAVPIVEEGHSQQNFPEPIVKLNPLDLGTVNQPIAKVFPIVSNSRDQSSKSSSISEYYLSHVCCESVCIARINTPRGSIVNRNIVDLEGDIVVYENPIGIDDADEYHSTDGENVLEVNTLAQSIIRGCWNYLHQPFPDYWNSKPSSESTKNSDNSFNQSSGDSSLLKELIQAPIIPLASIVILDKHHSNLQSELVINNQQLIVYNPLIVPPVNRINPMADQEPPFIPVTMRPRQPDDCPTLVVMLPKFYGELGSDLDYHVREFLTSCNANNARTPSHWHVVFPTTLDGHARQWFHRQPLGHFANWTALRDAFIAKFRPVAYND
jgi:hypothetical protein